MSCKATNCIYRKTCIAKSECTDFCCDDFETGKAVRRQSAYERTKAQVYATGNKWAIENFHATHD